MFQLSLTTYGQSQISSTVYIDGVALVAAHIDNISSLENLSLLTTVFDSESAGNFNGSSVNIRINDLSSSAYQACTFLLYQGSGNNKKVVAGYSHSSAIVSKTAAQELNLFLSFDASCFTNGCMLSSIQVTPATASLNADGIVHIENESTSADDTYSVYSKAQIDSILESSIPTVNNAKLTIKKNASDTGTEFTANASTDVTCDLDLATVATSGSYNDLSNKPTIPTVNNSTITIKKNSDDTGDSFTTNASSGKTINLGLSAVASSGSYNDLSNKPTIPTVNNASLTINKGGTDDTGSKTFTANASSNVTINLGLADVASSGSYNDLSNKPTIPTVNDTTITIKKNTSDTGDSFTTNTSTAKTIDLGLATVATSGSYTDLSNKPTIPTVNNATLTIQKNGSTVNTFTANASSDVTANITVPLESVSVNGTSQTITNRNVDIHVPADLTGSELIGGFVRYNVSGSGNLTISNTYGLFPHSNGTTTTLPAGTYLVRVRLRSTTSSYSVTVNFGTPYTISTSNGVIDDLRSVTLSSAQGFSASITQVNANTYIRVVLYEPGEIVTSVGAAAVTNDYNDLDNVPNGTLVIQKNGSNVASFSASANSNVTANISVPTTVASLSDASNYVTTNTAQTITGEKTFEDIVLHVDSAESDSNLVLDLYHYDNDGTDAESEELTLRPASDDYGNLGDYTHKYYNIWAYSFNGDLYGNASSASTLSSTRYIDGVGFNGSSNIAHYGECSTGASTQIKDVTIPNFNLVTGAIVIVKFTNTNSASSPQLRVNTSGTNGTAKPIVYRGTSAVSSSSGYYRWQSGSSIEFVYDGTSWVWLGFQEYAYYSSLASNAYYLYNSSVGAIASSYYSNPTRAIIPYNSNTTSDLGTSSSKWRTLYLSTSISNGTYTYSLPSATGTLALASDIPSSIDDLAIDSSIIPDSSGDYDLGSSSNIWDSVYANNFVGNATTASTLETSRNIDGVSFNGGASIVHYGTCETASNQQIKDVTIAGFSLETGARVIVKFANTNAYSNPQLRINTSGTNGTAKPIAYRGSSAVSNSSNYYRWQAGSVIEFVYDGTNWVWVGFQEYSYYSSSSYSSTYASYLSINGTYVAQGYYSNPTRALVPYNSIATSDLGTISNRWRTLYTDKVSVGADTLTIEKVSRSVGDSDFADVNDINVTFNTQVSNSVDGRIKINVFADDLDDPAEYSADYYLTRHGFTPGLNSINLVSLGSNNLRWNTVYTSYTDTTVLYFNYYDDMMGDYSFISCHAEGQETSATLCVSGNVEAGGRDRLFIGDLYGNASSASKARSLYYITVNRDDSDPTESTTLESTSSSVLTSYCDIIPNINSTSSSTGYNLGSSSYKWNILYTRVLGDSGTHVGTAYINNLYIGSVGTALSTYIANTTVTNATNATYVKVYTSSSNTSYPLVFANDLGSSSGVSRTLYTDTANSLNYNPSTNALSGLFIIPHAGSSSLSGSTYSCTPSPNPTTNSDPPEGAVVSVFFNTSNSVNNPQLKVGDWNAKPIYRTTSAAGIGAAESWPSGSVLLLRYNGSNWRLYNNNSYPTSTASGTTNIIPSANNSYTLGSSDYKWNSTYSSNIYCYNNIYSYGVTHILGEGASVGLRLCDGLSYESTAYCSITGYQSNHNGRMRLHHYNATAGIDYYIESLGPNTDNTSTTAATLNTVPMTNGTWSIGTLGYNSDSSDPRCAKNIYLCGNNSSYRLEIGADSSGTTNYPVVRPTDSGYGYIGTSGYRWGYVYTNTLNVSGENFFINSYYIYNYICALLTGTGICSLYVFRLTLSNSSSSAQTIARGESITISSSGTVHFSNHSTVTVTSQIEKMDDTSINNSSTSFSGTYKIAMSFTISANASGSTLYAPFIKSAN